MGWWQRGEEDAEEVVETGVEGAHTLKRSNSAQFDPRFQKGQQRDHLHLAYTSMESAAYSVSRVAPIYGALHKIFSEVRRQSLNLQNDLECSLDGDGRVPGVRD